MARRTLADLEAELYAGSPDETDAADPIDILTLRRLLVLLHGVMLEDEKRHQRAQSEATRRTWANTGKPKRTA